MRCQVEPLPDDLLDLVASDDVLKSRFVGARMRRRGHWMNFPCFRCDLVSGAKYQVPIRRNKAKKGRVLGGADSGTWRTLFVRHPEARLGSTGVFHSVATIFRLLWVPWGSTLGGCPRGGIGHLVV